jgi:cobalt/nickel transport system permease protein
MASILAVQALFFATVACSPWDAMSSTWDSFPVSSPKPLICRKILGGQIHLRQDPGRRVPLLLVALQLGAFAVSLKQWPPASAICPSPRSPFSCNRSILPSESWRDLATAAVITFVWNSGPAGGAAGASGRRTARYSVGKILIGLAVFAVLTGGVQSWFASCKPDGLEWSMFRAGGEGGAFRSRECDP